MDTLKDNAVAALWSINQFMSVRQRNFLIDLLCGEEKDHFITTILDMERRIAGMPKTYDQDGLYDKAVAYLHYFTGGCDWYITERDIEEEQQQAYGYANLGFGYEQGYISLIELAQNNVELDLYFMPKTIGELNLKKMYGG